MIARRGKNALSTVILVLVIALVTGAAATGGYYLSESTSASSQNRTNPSAITLTSTITSTVTVTSSFLHTTTITQVETQGQTLVVTQTQTKANYNNAVLNMTYSSSCISVDNSCSGFGYSILFTNTGNSVVSDGTVQMYFGNGTSIYGQASCTFNSTILPQYTFTCSGLTPSKVPAYSNVILSIVYPDGKTYSYTYTAPSGITLSSATLYGGLSATSSLPGTSSLTVALSNFGSATYITSVTMTGAGISTIQAWDNTTAASSANNLIVFTGVYSGNNAMSAGAVTSFTFYPENAAQQSITTGQVFNYVINFANGQSVSGSLIAQ